MSRGYEAFLVAFAAITFVAAVAQAAPERVQRGFEAFASEALQRHRPLFDADTLEQLDALNRSIREVGQQLREAPDDNVRSRLESERSALAQTAAALLDTAHGVIEIAPAPEGGVLPPLGTVELPGRRGGLLLRLGAGDGPPEFMAALYNFSTHSHYRLPIEMVEGAETWVLLGFEHAPHMRTHWELALQSGSGPATIVPFDLLTPEPGRLQVRILSDDTGEPAPAMVRLVWKHDGEDYRPSNALDFAPQFDRQGSYMGPRRALYPGKWAGPYWCVPGPFEMEVSAGEWEITVLRGVEHVPVTDTFTVAPGGTISRTYRPERWVHMAGRGWYSGDDHVHGQILSGQDAENLMAWIQAEDVRVANVVKMGDIYRTWFEQRGFGEAFRVEQDGYVLSPGQECPRTHGELGHTLHMNISHMIRDTDQYFLYDTVFEQVEADGGLSGYAHVNTGLFHVHRDMTINIPKGVVDFVEMLQFSEMGTDLYYEFLNLGFPVTASAGSDVPWGGTVGEVRVYAYLGDEPFTADAWFDAVDQGRTFVTNGVMVDVRVNGALPGDTITLIDDRPLRVRARAWGDARRLLPEKLEIVVNGDVVQEVAGGGEEMLELDFEVAPGNGCWIAVRAAGADASRAHTTPVYAVRPTHRFWKLDAVDGLIDTRLDSLRQIEEIVDDAKARHAAGEVDDNRTIRELALQGPALMERVNAARGLYEELRAQAARERSEQVR